MAKVITFIAAIDDEGKVSITISTNTSEPLQLMEMLGSLEIIRQAAILSSKDFKKMYETIKISLNDSQGSSGTSPSGG